MNKPICIPGQRICLLDSDIVGGRGTYVRQGYLYATLCGTVSIKKHIEDNKEVSLIEVSSYKQEVIVPSPGDIVTVRITAVQQHLCKAQIISVGDNVLSRQLRAILRRENVRATEIDRIEMYKCYRPGDIVLARVLPLKELHSYQLSTAENELGVVIALSEAGEVMVPISWTEMQCPLSKLKELRKVAKVAPEVLDVEDDSDSD
uniref:Exosome complex component CSL4 n=1 Tax=Cacopsylla melanoneura TaxID=428564 RepID=A0A8D8YC69_9HEMI